MRKIDELFARYGESHRDSTNKAIHWVCVPLITWSVIALLWSWTPIAAYALIVGLAELTVAIGGKRILRSLEQRYTPPRPEGSH